MNRAAEGTAVESRFDRGRGEWNLLIRRPFYLNLRLGRTQNALWIGGSRSFRTVFNTAEDTKR